MGRFLGKRKEATAEIIALYSWYSLPQRCWQHYSGDADDSLLFRRQLESADTEELGAH